MSQFPNQPGTGPNPFGTTSSSYQQPKPSNTWLWVLLGIGGVSLLLCLGCGGFGYFAMSKGFEVFEQNLQANLSTNPVAQQHLGEIQSVKMDFWAGVKETEERGKQTMLFKVVGSKGSAEVIGDQPPAGGQAVTNPILRLPGGEEIPL